MFIPILPTRSIIATTTNMNDKKSILERAQAIDEWIMPQRRAYHQQRVNDVTIDLEYGICLNYVLQAAIFSLKHFFEQVLIDPKSAIRNENDIERIAMVDFLLPRMERWMSGECTATVLALTTHEYCKNRIMSGDLTNMNCTSQMVNLLSVYDYRNYCELVKVINKVPISFEQAKADELKREQEELEKKAKRKGKQKA